MTKNEENRAIEINHLSVGVRDEIFVSSSSLSSSLSLLTLYHALLIFNDPGKKPF